jgi:hypothetical protein
MTRVGFEPTILVFEWAKAVHALDRTAFVINVIIIFIIISVYFVIDHWDGEETFKHMNPTKLLSPSVGNVCRDFGLFGNKPVPINHIL